MKKVFFWMLGCILSMMAATTAHAQELLTNNSFEEENTAGWLFDYATAGEVVADEGHTGTHSLLLEGTAYYDMPGYDFSDYFNANYSISFWYKTIDAEEDLYFGVNLIAMNTDMWFQLNLSIRENLTLPVSNDEWQQFTYTFNNADMLLSFADYNGTTLDIFDMEMNVGGLVLIDDISLTKGAPIPVTGIVLNRSNYTMPSGSAVIVKAAVIPWNASNKQVSWSSSNPEVATAASSSNIYYNQGITLETKVEGERNSNSDGKSTVITVTSADGNFTANMDLSIDEEYNYPEATGITLNKQTLSLDAGAMERLSYTITPVISSENCFWGSSDEKVARVDVGGNVYAIAPGTAYIIGATEYPDMVYDTCVVTVTAAPVIVAVEHVNLNKTALELKVNGAETLSATIAPDNATNKSVTWSSNNMAVATVDANGLVTAVAVGTAAITVTSVADTSKTAVCTVTVTEGDVVPIPVTGISLNKTALELKVNGAETLSATIAPDNATNKSVTWSSNNMAVATVDANGLVTAVAAGTAAITVTSVADTSKTAVCTVTVTGNVGIDEVENDNRFRLMENPVQDAVRFTFEASGQNARILIVDMQGKIVAQQLIPAGATNATIHVTHLSQGMYIARYSDNAKQSIAKFVK